MLKNEYLKNYDITIVGGGLTGKLMLSMLTNCSLFNENKLCWINTDNENDYSITDYIYNLKLILGFYIYSYI